MEITVRVISNGHEIDRITRSLQTDQQNTAIEYREQLWPVIGGCIHIDKPPVFERDDQAWAQLVADLIPESLPNQIEACSKILEALFREDLPAGVVQAAATLASLKFEQRARVLLVDVLKEKRDSDRIYRLLKMRLLFRKRTDSKITAPHHTESSSKVCHVEMQPQPDTEHDWEWAPSNENLDAPQVDDSVFRTAAALTQESIGAYRTEESGADIPELNDLASDEVLLELTSKLLGNQQDSMRESVLVERTAKLGETALDVLRYFADNPGDRAVHAEHILGYPATDINRLLNGNLSHYMKRSSSGGWECQIWTSDVLSTLDQKRDGT